MFHWLRLVHRRRNNVFHRTPPDDVRPGVSIPGTSLLASAASDGYYWRSANPSTFWKEPRQILLPVAVARSPLAAGGSQVNPLIRAKLEQHCMGKINRWRHLRQFRGTI